MHTHAYQENDIGCPGSSLIFRQDLFLSLELDWQPASPRDPPVSASKHAGATSKLQPCLGFYLNSRDSN